MINENPTPTQTDNPTYFRCRMCGECCSSWNIPIEGEKATALLEKDWVQSRLTDHRRELVKVTDALYRIPLNDENYCVFLAEDKRCLIEANEGLALKPDQCQRFPFAAVELPDGSRAYDTSAACKYIAESLLLAFQPILPLPDTGPEPETPALTDRIRLDWKRRIPYSRYQMWLQSLPNIFDNNAATPEQALERAYGNLTGRATQFSKQWSWPIVMFFLRKPYGSVSWLTLLKREEYHDPRVFGIPVRPLTVYDRTMDTESERLLKSFLMSLLSRKVLLTHGHSLSGVVALTSVCLMLVRWYAAMLAEAQDKTTVSEAETSLAIRLVERYYSGHQPRFLALFSASHRVWLVLRLLYR